MLGDPGAKVAQAVFLEILGVDGARWLHLGLDHAEKAFFDHLGRQTIEIRLEGIERGRAVREDASLALDLDHLTRQGLGDQLLHAWIAQVQPVASSIESVALALARDRQAAQVSFPLEKQPRRPQMQGSGDSGQTSAQDDDILGGIWLSASHVMTRNPACLSRGANESQPSSITASMIGLRTWQTRQIGLATPFELGA